MTKLPILEEECICNPNLADEHTCPYKEDIDGDYETLCSCCDFCIRNCMDNI